MSKNIFSTATTEQAVAEMMLVGGNGMKKLAACWLAFDADRRARLEAALRPDFDYYRQSAAQAPDFKPTLAQRAAQDVAAGDARN
ncbi:hypothetical protein LMG26696_03579 [Achromobacter pulmonis]|uniref:hypothetical protein n=1 Tax=Achromobacter pulmonis TaxID=1389932 RepID=UPI0014671CB0|nr:hypothetical protein [Achromobacter pulmonis]CAB3665104.1 hypothetical protein LMG26696_03579 [Achromobacter pulmonis]